MSAVIRNRILRRIQIIRLALRLYQTYKRIQHIQNRGGNSDMLYALYARAGRDIRETAYRLCGAIVKAGQFLSLRSELFPTAFTGELQGLQDAVPPAPYSSVEQSIAQIRDHLTRINEEPIASASLAQVHEASLPDGTAVAVKVLRPGIEQLVAIDLSTLGTIVRLLNKIPGMRERMDFVALHKTFVDTLEKELDMRVEAHHMRQFGQFFAHDSRIVIPQVYDEYTNRYVLVMTYLSGANVKDSEQLAGWNINRTTVRDTLLDIYLHQIFRLGMVHLDPHPGNLLVFPDGRLGLLDFGMMGEYGSAERAAFRHLIQSVVFRDTEGITIALVQLGYLRNDTDVRAFATDLNSSFGEFNSTIIRSWLGRGAFRLQAQYMLLLRCLGLLKTVLTLLTPTEADWLGVLSEHAFKVLSSSDEDFAGNAHVH